MTTETNSLAARIKQSTQPLHDKIEQNMFVKDLFSSEPTKESYKNWLLKFYGFYIPVEAQFNHFAELAAEPVNFPERVKLPLLENDLNYLGVDQDALTQAPRCEAYPELNNIYEALGCLYVLEGSTMGGQIMSRKVKTVFDFEEDKGNLFFKAYGKDSKRMWEIFKNFLNEYPMNDVQQQQTLDSATHTFKSLMEWFKLSSKN